jgi:NADPH:quinone reductase-like Zn-dependent oxidoreductase
MFAVVVRNLFIDQDLGILSTEISTEDLETLAALIDGGTIHPVIGWTYSLQEVPDAVRHLETGHARGNIVITIT